MTKDCIFCKIISGDLPADKIYEDDVCMAFEALHQVSPGHALIIPKKHSQDILDAKTTEGIEILSAVQKIGTGIMKGLNAQGFNIGVNTKSAAGQVVFHTHIHLIPRYENDKLKMWPEKETTTEERALFAQKIISALD